MKKINYSFIASLITFVFVMIYTPNVEKYKEEINLSIDTSFNIKKISKEEMLKMNSKIESRHRWNVANKYGYVGKYQIGRLVLIDLGYDSLWIEKLQKSIYKKIDTCVVSNDTIIRSFYYFDVSLFPPKKQEEVIKKMLHKNEFVYLKKHIEFYVGKKIDGVRITKAGILSSSFLGVVHVHQFLKSNGKINPRDANGYSVKDRMLHFEKFELI